MLEVSKKVLTDFGARCQAQAMAGRKITFTVFQLGAGEYTGNETVAELMEATALKEKKQEFGISKMELSEAADTVILTLIAINSSVNIGYNIREIGVFARDANGTQGLYSLCVAKPDKADWMPAYNGIDPVTLVYRDYLRIGNTENVLIDLNSEGLVSTKIFEETVTELREEMENPEFEDYSGENAEVPDARTAIAGITSKKSIFKILSNVKAALMGVVTLGEMRALLVNNGLCTEAGKYFLDAAYGKTLQDQIAQQNSDKLPYNKYGNFTANAHVDTDDSGTVLWSANRPDGTIQCISFYADGAVTIGKKTADGKWTNKYLANPGFDQDTFEGRIIATQSPSGQYGMRLYSGDDGWLWVDVYRSSATEGITRRLQWNCLPNQPYLQFIEIDNATGQVKYLKDFMAHKAEYWSGVESVTTIADQWIQGTRKIAVPPGQYMIVAHGKLPFSQPNSVCVHVRNDNNNMALQSYYTAIKCPDEMDTQFTYSFFQYLPTTDNLWLEFLSRGPVTVIETEISAIRLD